VPKHKQQRRPATLDPGTLEQRVERALGEQRYQHALDLAKTLHRLTSAPQTVDLLIRAAFGRAGQLAASNYQRDAAAVLASVVGVVQSQEQKEKLAVALAESGEFEQALRVAAELASPPLTSSITGHIADAALRGRAIPSGGFPADFHGHKDLIIKAFAEVESGQDEQARATLQAIGLSSPFLEWKVLLRGLMAYYLKDDAKALENFQRLSPERVPARLAAAFRQAIDPTYRLAQNKDTQTRLRNLYDQLQGAAFGARLALLQQSLADPQQLAAAFRQAESLLPLLKAEGQQFVTRLAHCFYWAVIDHGFPEDLKRYQRVFGAPPDDPEMNRMEALAVEHRGDFEQAHDAWQRFEKGLAQHADQLPLGHANRLRALVWQRMAHNAELMPDKGMLGFLSPFPGRPAQPKGLKPDAETCLKRGLELAPDQLEAHFKLVAHYFEANKFGKALQAAKRLLKQFPQHVPTLELAGSLCLRKPDYRAAVDYFAQAVQANPLAAKLRDKLSMAHNGLATELSQRGQFAEARVEFQAALALADGGLHVPMLCSWAGMEFHAGETTRAEELLQQAHAIPGHELAIAFHMLVLAIRMKLGKALKGRFDTEFRRMLLQPPSAASAATVAGMRLSGVKYAGQKTHEKQILTYLEKALKTDYTEAQMVTVCSALGEWEAVKLLRKYFALGQGRFPKNPQFYLAEIDYNLSLPPYRADPLKSRTLLDKVRELASTLPPGERAEFLEAVEDREESFKEQNPFSGLFGDGDFGGLWPGDEFEDDFDDDDMDDDWTE
jgi:tetratricopeptide (TPR) repeat protein